MSIYGINKLLYLLENDAQFRKDVFADPTAAVNRFSLTSEERSALTSGDVGKLFNMGVHPFLLNGMNRHGLFGVTRDNYFPRIRGQETPRPS